MRLFRDALVAVAPILKRAQIDHQDGAQYDDYDRVAEALFESVVLSPLRNSSQVPEDMPFSKYDFKRTDRAPRPLFLVHDRDEPDARYIFRSLGSDREPFDAVRVHPEIDEETDVTIP